MRLRTSMMAGAVFSVATWLTIYGSAAAIYVGASWYISHPLLLLLVAAVVDLTALTWMATYVVRTWGLAPLRFHVAVGSTSIFSTATYMGLIYLLSSMGLRHVVLMIFGLFVGVVTLLVAGGGLIRYVRRPPK